MGAQELVWIGGTPVEVSTDGKWHYWVAFTYHREFPVTGGIHRTLSNGGTQVRLTEPLISRQAFEEAIQAIHANYQRVVPNHAFADPVMSTWTLLRVPPAAVPHRTRNGNGIEMGE